MSELATVYEPSIMPMLEPAPLEELLSAQQKANEVTVRLLKAGVDFDTIKGTDKPSLLKPGAEKILWAYNCYPEYTILDQETDHDREVIYYDRNGKELRSYGLYRFVVLCRVIHRPTGRCVGTGIGSASTLESKFISRPRDLENTVLKMAQKRALVAATLNAFALSDRFTQDMEDAEVAAVSAGRSDGELGKRFAAACHRLNQSWKQKEQTALASLLCRALGSREAAVSFVESCKAPREVLLKALQAVDREWMASNADEPPQMMDVHKLTDYLVRAYEASAAAPQRGA